VTQAGPGNGAGTAAGALATAGGPRGIARGARGGAGGAAGREGEPSRGQAVVAAQPLGLSSGGLVALVVVACALVGVGFLTKNFAKGER
jgi:hypothetical protein